MIERRPIHRAHLRDLFALKVAEDQQRFVAPNEITLAQQAYEPGAYVWSLWDDTTLVGLIAMVHPGEYPDNEPEDDLGAAFIWRLMIGEAYQGRGFGRQAIEIARTIAREWGLPRVNLSFVDAHGSAEGFYSACGFRRTGRMIGDEVEMVRDA